MKIERKKPAQFFKPLAEHVMGNKAWLFVTIWL